MQLWLDRYVSPLADLLLVTDDDGVLRALDYADYESRMRRLLRIHYRQFAIAKDGDTQSVRRALDAYFDGDLGALRSIPTSTGGTPFQREVWHALRAIEPATTQTYGQIAAKLGRAKASRAVGAANGANPIAIIVPCHRVIGANETLTGYAGGLERKQWLLDHERQSVNEGGSTADSGAIRFSRTIRG
jgi:O-6-methylguanine DNA methyltransferase